MSDLRNPAVVSALVRRANKVEDPDVKAFLRQYLAGDIEVKHCAKFSKVIIERIREILDRLSADYNWEPTVLDPFAGVGGIHHLRHPDTNGDGYHTVGVEIEWEWYAVGRLYGTMLHADFFEFEWDRERWDGGPEFIVTSCTYGNRFADKHNARDGSRRRSYTHDLGHQLQPNNSGAMQWGKQYRSFHRKAWLKCYQIQDPGGYLVLNVSDHIRGRKVMKVAQWHKEALEDVGYELVEEHAVETQRHRDGANGALRVECEWVYVFRK